MLHFEYRVLGHTPVSAVRLEGRSQAAVLPDALYENVVNAVSNYLTCGEVSENGGVDERAAVV